MPKRRPATVSYPGLWNHSGWIATPTPPEYGQAVRSVLAEIASWDAEQVTKVVAAFVQMARRDPGKMVPAAARVTNTASDYSITRHYISDTGTPISLAPWFTAIRLGIGDGPDLVLKAVAVRDHRAISDDDWSQVTKWWTDLGLALPEPISDTERADLVRWMLGRGAWMPGLSGGRP